MTRAEHLQWAKDRALEYVEVGDTVNAFASMASDLGKHEGTAGHMAIELGVLLVASGQLSTPAAMREFINGFN